MATIYEVARLAGVSPATVSRVFNGAKVSEARATSVLKAAKQLSFSPNRSARTLRLRRSEVVALIIPDIENPYFTELARGVEDVMQRAGFSLVMCNTDADPGKEARYIDIAVSEQMAGIIIAAASSRPDLERALSESRPVVAVDRHIDYDLDEVVIDNFEAGRAATAALIDSGYTRIACVSGPQRVETARQRVEGWRTAIERLPQRMPNSFQIYSAFNVESGRDAMEELLTLPEPPDAIVAANNLIGVGAIQVLTERGLTPPKFGVAVVGSLPFSTLSPSVVSVVQLPAREMGVTAAKSLLSRINGDKRSTETLILSGQLRPAVVVKPVA